MIWKLISVSVVYTIGQGFSLCWIIYSSYIFFHFYDFHENFKAAQAWFLGPECLTSKDFHVLNYMHAELFTRVMKTPEASHKNDIDTHNDITVAGELYLLFLRAANRRLKYSLKCLELMDLRFIMSVQIFIFRFLR